MTDPIKKIGFRNGLILGCFLILLSTYINFFHLELLTNVWLGFSTVFILVAFGIFSILQTKTKLGGLISFKEAFSTYFYTILVGNLMSTIYLLILYLFVLTPETKDLILQGMREFDINLLKQNLMPQKNIDDTLEFYKTYNPFTISTVFTGFIKYLLRDCLIGFLVALIFRNKRTL
ncbi:DUF4199 domain-containing protein [Flavobacterium sp. SM2513]|uniref:DUF4199 domain-containing protein n=1 Tax=Flavobacterium sp. SM2513 TaxID=3424766 RepID=UPI003D7F9170